MFDVGFFEMMLIGIVLLLVVGPERLPKVARTAGLWLGKARSMVASVKADIDRELAAEELKKALGRQAELPGLHDILEETRDAVDAVDELDRPKPDYQVKAIPDQPTPADAETPSPPKSTNDDSAR